MANSRRSGPGGNAPVVRRVEDGLRGRVRSGDRLLVGLSGGLDSVVLLDILGRIARRRRIRLSALYVNHQLSPNAPAWERFCRRACRERSIPFRSVRVTVARGDGVEASARAARYAVLLAQPAEYVVLAHHQDDQAETVLLQLLRGAGVRGLAAMPLLRLHPSILRPLLDVPRSELERYARERKLAWVEDESNRDTRFARNFLRHELLPALAARFPAYRATLARSARHLGEAARLLDELAASDAAGAYHDGVLAVAALRERSSARARNLLRWFVAQRGVAMPGSRRLDEALRQALTARPDAHVRIELPDATLRRFEGRLYVIPVSERARPDFTKRWRGERTLALPELNGVLTMTKSRGSGISLTKLQSNAATLRTRRGAERLQPDCRRPRRSLKNLLQESHVPPWQRDQLPLLFCGEDLVWAPGIGIACKYQAKAGESSIIPDWTWAAPSGFPGKGRPFAVFFDADQLP